MTWYNLSTMNPLKSKHNLNISDVPYPKVRYRGIVRDQTKQFPNPSRVITKPCSSISKTWGSWWTHLNSNDLGQLCPSSSAVCTCDLSLGLAPFCVCSFPWQRSHRSGISSVLGSPAISASPSQPHVMAFQGICAGNLVFHILLAQLLSGTMEIASITSSFFCLVCI